MAQASNVGSEIRMATPMAPVIGGDAEAAAQSAQILHPKNPATKTATASVARTRGMSWYVYLLAAAAVVIGVGLLIGTWG
jgi:hypothetical protein